MRITGVLATPLFTGTATQPHQVVRVTVAGPDTPTPGPVIVRVEGPGVSTRQPFRLENLPPGAEHVAEVAVSVAAPHGPGSRLSVTAIAEAGSDRATRTAEMTVAEPGWTMWMVCHFHYDPVWWNTQGEFTETQLAVPGEDGRLPDVRAAFELVRLHLDAARDDPDYKFVLAEVDYLKPYFDVHPEDRAELRELIAAGRVEIVGGAYNEPNTNLTSAESTIRNIVYGLGQQRDVLGADPSVAWALDAFGHDPGYPGLMAAAGMTGSAWARGPYHQWGPWRTVGDNARMQFPSEFEWISPDGSGLLTSYMANHYGAGWVIHQAADPAAAQAAALSELKLNSQLVTYLRRCEAGSVQAEVRVEIESPGQQYQPWSLDRRLSETDIQTIIADFLSGTPKHLLANRYSVSLSALKNLLRRRGIHRDGRPDMPH